MDVEQRAVGELVPYPHNPRVNDPAVDAVAASIREFGFRQPIVVDEHSVVVAGHTRLKAAVKLGLASVPVHVARGLTPEQARAYRLADNRTAQLAAWDDPALARELAALQADGADLAVTAFPDDELARLLAMATGDDDAPVGGTADPEDVPDPPVEAVTRPGDVWTLGPHRLVCGDATRPDHLARLMGGEPADLLLTDPPYGVAYQGGTADRLTLANDDLDPPALRAFYAAALTAALPHLKPGSPFYLWHADLLGLVARQAVADAGLRVRQCLVWAKPALVLGRQDYHWRHEPCLYGWAEGAAHPWFGGRAKTTVLEFDKPSRNPDHPTPKPAALFAELVGNSCPPGGVVLDPFAGSGTTLAACHATGRVARLMELDPRYCDVVVRRYEGLTGQTAGRTPAAG